MPLTKSLLKSSRLIHLYLGVFTTPALIFFAFTGFLQTFSFHETTRGSDYKPPKIFVQLSQLHKKQTFVLPERKPPAVPQPVTEKSESSRTDSAKPVLEGPRQDRSPDKSQTSIDKSQVKRTEGAEARPGKLEATTSPTGKKQNLWPMKIFFAIVAGSLLLSTITGLYMAYTYIRNKTLVTAALLAGIIIPVLFLLL